MQLLLLLQLLLCAVSLLSKLVVLLVTVSKSLRYIINISKIY